MEMDPGTAVPHITISPWSTFASPPSAVRLRGVCSQTPMVAEIGNVCAMGIDHHPTHLSLTHKKTKIKNLLNLEIPWDD